MQSLRCEMLDIGTCLLCPLCRLLFYFYFILHPGRLTLLPGDAKNVAKQSQESVPIHSGVLLQGADLAHVPTVCF
jgi:hypothetical protein